MKTKKRLFVGLVAVIFAVWGITSAASAAEKEAARGEANPEAFVVGSLGTAAAATDVYHVHCGAGSARLNTDVNDNGGVDGVRIHVLVADSGGNPAIGTTSPDNGISATLGAFGGAGSYYVYIFKSPSATSEAYDSIMQCRNSAGASTTTVITLVQNQ
jgi:hypothetical protein